MNPFMDTVISYVICGILAYVFMRVSGCFASKPKRQCRSPKQTTQDTNIPHQIPDTNGNLIQTGAQIAQSQGVESSSLKSDYFDSESLADEPFGDEEDAMEEDNLDDVYQDMIQRKYEFRDDDDDNDPDYVPVGRKQLLGPSSLGKHRHARKATKPKNPKKYSSATH